MEQIAIGAALVLVPELVAAGIVFMKLRAKHRRDTLEFVLRMQELWDRQQARHT